MNRGEGHMGDSIVIMNKYQNIKSTEEQTNRQNRKAYVYLSIQKE